MRAYGTTPKTWKSLRIAIMKQFLTREAEDQVLTEWISLKMLLHESINKYIDKFWDLHLKVTVFRKIDFTEKKQQFLGGLPEEMNKYINFQRPRTMAEVIHHSIVASKINFQQGVKKQRPMEYKEEFKGKGNFTH